MKTNRKFKLALTLSLILVLGFSFNAVGKNFNEKSSIQTFNSADGTRTFEVYDADCISKESPILTLTEA